MGIQDLVLQLLLASVVLAAVCLAQSCPTFQNGCRCYTYGSGVGVSCYRLGLTSFPVLPEDIQGNIGRLDLYGNNLREIPDNFFANLTQLQYLYLHYNDIGYIEPGTFSTTTQLRALWLSGNILTEIPGNLFANLTQLQRLDLSDNNIGYIEPGTFSTTTPLTSLWLQGNNLREIPDNLFTNLTQLQYLDLSGNNLTEIPDNLFANLTQLRFLYLHYNDIGYIEPGTFSTTTQLRELWLSVNDIEYIEPGTFSTTTQLTSLLLRGNNLREIPDNLFTNLTQLQYLGLERNNLMAIPDNLFANLTQLQTLDLSSNPLHCDCRLSWIQSYIQANPNVSVQGTCVAPENVRGRPVNSLQEEEFICEVGLSQMTYMVAEDAGTVSVCIDATTKSTLVKITTMDETAIAGEDYVGLSDEELDIMSSWECVEIIIIDDMNVVQDSRTFRVQLTSDDPSFTVALSSTTVTITDTTRVDVGYVDDPYTVNERAGTAQVCVSTTGSTTLDRDVMITLSTVTGGTATAGVDYTEVGNTVLTLNNSQTRDCVDIIISDDGVVESTDPETIVLMIMSSDSAVNIAQPLATVSITDATPATAASSDNIGPIAGGVVGGILGVVVISITFTLILILFLRSCSAKRDVQHTYAELQEVATSGEDNIIATTAIADISVVGNPKV